MVKLNWLQLMFFYLSLEWLCSLNLKVAALVPDIACCHFFLKLRLKTRVCNNFWESEIWTQEGWIWVANAASVLCRPWLPDSLFSKRSSSREIDSGASMKSPQKKINKETFPYNEKLKYRQKGKKGGSEHFGAKSPKIKKDLQINGCFCSIAESGSGP